MSIATMMPSIKRELGSNMSFHRCCRLLILALILVPALRSLSAVAAEPALPQYVTFPILLGAPERQTGVFQRGRSNEEILSIARRIPETVRPARTDPNRILGFAVGPIAMDQGEDDARSVIRGAFDAALATDMAVALHLDDYMFWARARWPDGRPLRAAQGTTEWKDWSQTPAGGLEIGYMQNV